ncbi:hypothetical protein ElyMa_003338300 [Elysia marginata]|uniref:Uncharacterized protein n=1 Tax=Elysia marginata TaxID=1093978 RepID=A0AAV4JF08_9GAST|nr:hypothetical protein ElyMa_003338300 [Elysia marginata]
MVMVCGHQCSTMLPPQNHHHGGCRSNIKQKKQQQLLKKSRKLGQWIQYQSAFHEQRKTNRPTYFLRTVSILLSSQVTTVPSPESVCVWGGGIGRV